MTTRTNEKINLSYPNHYQEYCLQDLNFSNDIYYNSKYVTIYGEQFEFLHQKQKYFLKIIATKTRIEDSCYFDIQTPYGYGGFAFNGDEEFLCESLKKLQLKAINENIIAFFIRFHPFDMNLSLYSKIFPYFNKNRRVVIVDTRTSNFRKFYHKKIQSPIKKARNILKLEFVPANEIESFKDLYHKTMLRANAERFYFFDLNYFKKLCQFQEYVTIKANYENRDLAFASFFLCEDFSYYHLSANTGEMSANAALLDLFFEYAHSKNSKFCILGGGIKDGDNLYFFKQRFSNLECDFYIGGLVFNQNIFDDFCKNHQNNKFLKYRIT